MRLSSSVFCLVLGAPLGLAACGAQEAEAIVTSDRGLQLVADAPIDPDDAFGACVVDEAGGYIPFECSAPEAGFCNGWGGLADCSEGGCEGGGYYVLCKHECQVDVDCPRPETGTSEPVCSTAAFCQLPCDEATQCPDGYSCELTPSFAQNEFLPSSCVQRFDFVRFAEPADDPTPDDPDSTP